MALTKVTGHVIKSDTNIISHNINSSGIITAVTFDGNVSGVAVTFTGDSTIGSLGITTNLTVGGNIDVDGQTNLDHVSIAGVTTVTGEIKIPDLSGSSNKISVGTNQNLQIYYDSSSYITNGTAGHLFLKTLNGGSDIRLESNDDIFLMTAGGTRNSIICRDYAQVELYYNNTKRFETTNTGAVVSGILTATSFSGDGSSLSNLPAGAPVGGASTNTVFFENDKAVAVNYQITSTKNAMSAGPITINAGIAVTVPSGSSWTIV